MKKISLNNFLKMSPEAPQYTDKNQHYLISGANPTYYNDISGVQEEQIAPLIASNVWQLAYLNDGGHGSVGSSHITSLIPNPLVGSPLNDAFGIDIYGNIFMYSIYNNSCTNYGAVISGINSGDNAIHGFAGLIIAIVYTSAPFIYSSSSGSSGTWTSLYPVALSGGANGIGQRYMEQMGQFLYISDGLDSSHTMSQVKLLSASFVYIAGIDLGIGWTITGIRNFNDKYMAITANNANFSGDYLFLWNGQAGVDPQYKAKIEGQYIDMAIVNSILYVAVRVSGTGNSATIGKTAIFYLKNNQLVPLLTPQISLLSSGYGDNGVLFNFSSKLGMNLVSKDLMIYGDSEIGKEEFVLSTGRDFNKFCVTANGYLLAVDYYTFSPYYYNLSSTTFNQISYKSHWIPVKNLQGLDIWYDAPPSITGDKISVTIYADGENIITGTQTIVLADITPTHYLNKKRTRLDVVGFAGDRCKIVLTTTQTSTFRPIIRGIDLITK